MFDSVSTFALYKRKRNLIKH